MNDRNKIVRDGWFDSPLRFYEYMESRACDVHWIRAHGHWSAQRLAVLRVHPDNPTWSNPDD